MIQQAMEELAWKIRKLSTSEKLILAAGMLDKGVPARTIRNVVEMASNELALLELKASR